MNKKAQALALFITVIPVIFVVVMFVYESSVFVNKKSNTESILESTMMDAKKYNLSILLLKLKYTFVIKIKGNKMKIKAFLSSGRFKIINVFKINEMKVITANYPRCEYVL